MNLKAKYKQMLNTPELTQILGNGKISSAYPQEVKTFPLVVYEDDNSRDICFSDNLPEGTQAQVRIHIFTKTIGNYPTTTEIAEVIRNIFRNDLWAMTANRELSDVDDNIRHRVMDFSREFYSL